MQGRNRDADVENGHVDAVGAGEGGANWESTKISFFNVACYLQNHLERGFDTLDFYKAVSKPL